MKKESGKKGGKKIGRNLRKPSSARYTSSMRWVTNKLKKLKKHLKSHPHDEVAFRAYHGGKETE